MPKTLKIVIDGYLKRTVLGREGEKDVTIEYSSAEALKLAEIELMGRDLKNHLPILLRTTYEISPESDKIKAQQQHNQKPKTKNYIGGRRTSDS